ncbi:MAG: CapA family protein [Treponema sp.]|jgi:poly-gamma-glutamate synthesis protein (capsule biosynthesis protein)|nr:CapA family protein [Treponema sp.]
MKARYAAAVFCALLVCSCKVPPRLDPVVLRGGDGFPRERDFLLSLLGEGEFLAELGFRLSADSSGETGGGPVVFIDFFSSWEFENNFGDLPLSKTWYVPREDALAGRQDTALAACLGSGRSSGGEVLVPLAELAPPFVALRVGGLSVEDEGYPLVRVTGIGIGGTEKARAGTPAKIGALEAALRAAAGPLVEEPPGVLWIAAGGDLMLDRGAAEILFEEGPEGIFGATAALLAGADLALVNLEGVVSDRGTKVKKSFNFRFDPRVAGALREAGIDGVLQANNHTFDYGEEAFRDSLRWLTEAGIAVLGAGIDIDAAARPFLFRKGDCQVRTFGIASFPRERNGWDGLTVAAAEGKAGLLHARRGGGEKLKAHFAGDGGTPPSPESLDVVLFHGGVEWAGRPDAFTREFYTDLIRHGADLVIGSHPHVVQGFEWVLGKPVFWSLGNYVFGGMENTEGGEEGLFIRMGFSGGRLAYLEPFALALSHTRTAVAPAPELKKFYALSGELREAAAKEAAREAVP